MRTLAPVSGESKTGGEANQIDPGENGEHGKQEPRLRRCQQPVRLGALLKSSRRVNDFASNQVSDGYSSYALIVWT